MKTFAPTLPGRLTTTFFSLAGLGAIALWFVYLNTGVSFSLQLDTDRGPAPALRVEVERTPLSLEAITNVRDLPIRAPVRPGLTLEMWARDNGPALLAQMPALSPWDEVMLGRFMAVQPLAFEAADRLGVDPLWLMQILASESALDPLAQGPEPGDRGLGQVSFDSERTAAAWAADERSPYYIAGFDRAASIWDPRQNVTLAATVLRSLYVMPDIETNAQAYARYTAGLGAVKDSKIAERTRPRVERAASYGNRFQEFLALAYFRDDRAEAPSVARAGLVPEILKVTRGAAPGLPRYLALRDLYLEPREREYAISPWSFVIRMEEAVTFSLYAERLGAGDATQELCVARDALRGQMARIEANREQVLADAGHQTLARTEAALADRGEPDSPRGPCERDRG